LIVLPSFAAPARWSRRRVGPARNLAIMGDTRPATTGPSAPSHQAGPRKRWQSYPAANDIYRGRPQLRSRSPSRPGSDYTFTLQFLPVFFCGGWYNQPRFFGRDQQRVAPPNRTTEDVQRLFNTLLLEPDNPIQRQHDTSYSVFGTAGHWLATSATSFSLSLDTRKKSRHNGEPTALTASVHSIKPSSDCHSY